jgi:hypothetical protein
LSGAVIAEIRQLADVAAGAAGTMAGMEIRIVLDHVEPPDGRLLVVPDTGPAQRHVNDEGIPFAGWLGLLRALYEVTGAAASGVPGG